MNFETWEKVGLSKICRIICGATPSTKVPEYWSNDIKWATAKDVSESNGYKLYDTERKISKLGFNNCSTEMIPSESTVLIARGATMGKSCMLGECMAINQTCYALIPNRKRVNPYFLFYYIKYLSPYFQQIANGAIFNTVIGSSLRDIQITLPPLTIQRRIADILSALDDKIELNRQTNATLEAIAQAIFNEWFVDFNFPGATGEMVESELGLIPKGWRVDSILLVAELLSGGTPSTKNNEYWNGDIKWISAKDVSSAQGSFVLDTERKITRLGVKNSNTKILPKLTTIVTARGTVGSYCILSEPMAMNQTNYGLKAKDQESDYFVFFSLANLVAQLQQASYGTIFDTVTTITFEKSKIIIPPYFIIWKFDQLVRPLMITILGNLEQSNTLSKIRDYILPKLMNGEIDV